MECLENATWLPVLFLILAGCLTIAVAKHNGFGVKNSLLAAIGGKNFERTPLINVLNAAALLIPLGLMAWIVTTCAA
jgi:hypothetical protein